MPKHVGTLRGALERTVYEVVKCALEEAMKRRCSCGAEAGKLCQGVPFLHAGRLRIGVRDMLENTVFIRGER